MLVGVGGIIGSGKTKVTKILESYFDFFIISADVVSKDVLDEVSVIEYLKKNIPEVIINNKINRKILRSKLFMDPELNISFTKFIWPLISSIIEVIYLKNKDSYKNIVIEAAILEAIKLKYDKKILVECEDENIIYDRILKRDYKTDKLDEIKSIINFQKSKINKTWYDFIINNDKNDILLIEQINKIIK